MKTCCYSRLLSMWIKSKRFVLMGVRHRNFDLGPFKGIVVDPEWSDKQDPDQRGTQYPDPDQCDADPQHCSKGGT